MAITIDWGTKVINIPQADLVSLGGDLYELNTETKLRADVNALAAGEEGMAFETPINHNTEVTIAGVTYARTIEFINGYTITFEDLQYRVNLLGSNNNVTDVLNLNQVSVIPSNSAGLAVPGYTAQDSDAITKLKWMFNRQVLDSDGLLTLYDDDDTTIIDQMQIYTVSGAKYSPPGDVPAERKSV